MTFPREYPPEATLEPHSRAWPGDENNQMVFLKIPQKVDLSPSMNADAAANAASLVALPTELKWMILSLLPAVDRVCLSITCKALAASAIKSPYLKVPPWTPWILNIHYDFVPSRNELIRRLAHGWIDKSHLRYCQTCHKILPRDPQYWWQRLIKKKTIPWDVKVGLEKEIWKKMSKKKRCEYIVKTWCESENEDSSIFACRTCVRARLDNPRTRDLEKGTQPNVLGLLPRVPVECPVCIEYSLTNTWKEPRKPKVRPFLWKWLKKTMSFLGNTMLVLVYLLYLLCKAPFDLGLWLWKKYKGNKPKFKRAFTGMLCTSKQET